MAACDASTGVYSHAGSTRQVDLSQQACNKKIPLSLGQVASGRPQRWERKQKNNADCDKQSRMDVPVAFNRVVVDLGQAVPRPHHNLVQFWVP